MQTSYRRFAAMIGTSTVVMYGLMYLNTYAYEHVFWSETRAGALLRALADRYGPWVVAISRALIGKYAGDTAEVKAPGGIREYEILDVKYI